MSQRTGRKIYIPLAVGIVLQALPVFFAFSDLPAALCSLCWPLFMLIAVRNTERPRQVVFSGFVFWFSFCIRYGTFLGFGFVNILIACAVYLPVCFVLWLPFVIDRLLIRQTGSWFAILVFPLLYTLVCVVLNQLSLPVMGDPSCAVIALPLLAQNVSVLLSYGLCFLVLWFSSLLALALCGKRAGQRIAALITAVVIAAALPVYGAVRLSQRTEPAGVLHIAVFNKAESDFTAPVYPYTEAEATALFEEHLAFAAGNKADLAVSTEEYLYFMEENEEEKLAGLSAIIAKYGIPVLLSVDVENRSGHPYSNRTYMYDGNGQLLGKYIKHTLVPVVENGYYRAGKEDPLSVTLDLGGIRCRIAAAICYDCANPLFIRRIPADTQLLINPCWEWDTANAEQRRMTALRAIENNVTLFKPTYDGWTYAVDPWGIFSGMTDTRPLRGQAYMMDVPVYTR